MKQNRKTGGSPHPLKRFVIYIFRELCWAYYLPKDFETWLKVGGCNGR